MKCGQRVRITVRSKEYRGRTGIVTADTVPGESVDVEFEDEAISHPFNADEVEPIDDE